MDREQPWGSYQEWHKLLDAVCIQQGHLDNMALASAMSAVSGNRSGEAFEAALKNLRNWRSGSNLPQKRNFVLLTKVLRIDAHEELQRLWTTLYEAARKSAPGATGMRPAHGDTVSKFGMKTPLAMTFAALTVVAIGTIYLLQSGFEVSAEGVQAADVEYRKSVSLKVGESIVVHGARGACGGSPPAWEIVAAELPELEIGTWADGRVGTRYSRKCGGPTPARGIVFKATNAGAAKIDLYGDPVRIEVK